MTNNGIFDIDPQILTALENKNWSKARELIDLELLTENRTLPEPTLVEGKRIMRDWLIPQWLPKGKIGTLSGAGAVGKSRIAQQLLFAMSTQCPWLDVPLSHQPLMATMFVCYEDDDISIKTNIAGIQDLHDMPHSPVAGFYHMNLSGFGPGWGSESRYAPAKLTDIGVHIRRMAELYKVQMLVIDPSAANYGGDENDRQSVRAFMTSWVRWCEDTGCTVLIINHPSKTASSENWMSGSTDWANASRYAWDLRPAGEWHGAVNTKARRECKQHKDFYVLYCRKNSYAKIPPPKFLHRNENGIWYPAGVQPECYTGEHQ